ncbi:hypothetical protein KYC5002_26210 [Archangium violaceum]|uniref:hypothetical protein n=1 Tax=Archangium violaceum TaxID=83451 RepID=UPI002B286851|nr:hypothetical protein KYC5002_26210 [Archangium gephyra]
MDAQTGHLLSIVLLKAVTILTGLACIGMGYRLFMAGVFKGGAEIDANVGRDVSGSGAPGSNAHGSKDKWGLGVRMARGGPGLVFALFGAAIVIVGVTRDSWVRYERTSTNPITGAVVVESEEVHPYIRPSTVRLRFLLPEGTTTHLELRRDNDSRKAQFDLDGSGEFDTGFEASSSEPVLVSAIVRLPGRGLREFRLALSESNVIEFNESVGEFYRFPYTAVERGIRKTLTLKKHSDGGMSVESLGTASGNVE